MKRLFLLAGLSLVASSAFAQGGEMLLVDSGRDVILRISAFDGSIIQDNFIVDIGAGSPFDFQTPKDVDYVGNEIWVSDQIADAIFRFSRAGAFLGQIGGGPTGGLDNLRGGAVVGNEYWVTNDGSGNGALAQRIYRFGFDGSALGSFGTTGTSPFDILVRGNEVLISDFDTDDIDRYDFSGNFLGAFVNSDGVTGIDAIQQMAFDGTNLIAAGFSPDAGVYRYDASGVQNGFWSTGGTRGVTRFGNGTYGYTVGGVFSTVNPLTNQVNQVYAPTTASFQYFSQVDPIPEPVTMTVLGLGLAAVAARRRRK